MRVIVVLSLFLVLTGVLPMGCCDPPLEYIQLDGIKSRLMFRDSSGLNSTRWVDAVDSLTVNADTVYISWSPHGMKFIASTNFPTFGLIGSANARSCEHWGQKGLQDKIVNIDVQSTEPFLGIPAGESIKQFVMATREHQPDSLIAIDAELNRLNSQPYGQRLAVISKPDDDLYRRFVVVLIFTSGKVISDSTVLIKWE